MGATIKSVKLLGLVGSLAGLAGCTPQPDSAEKPLETSEQPLSTTAARTLGFESLQDWGPHWSSPTLQLNTLHTEGLSSLSVKGGGWMSVISRQLTKQDLNDPVPSVVGVDVRVPLSPLNPNWFGTVEFFVDVPSAGIWSQPLGSVDLSSSGFVPGQFRRAQVSVPASVQSALNGQFTDLRFRVAINSTSGEPGAYLLDRFTYGPGVCTPQPDGNPCTTDTCVNGQPAWTPLPQGTACDTNANVCDGTGTCNASASCVLGAPPVVDDGNLCTTDTCNPVSGVSHTPKAAGTSCSDGNACNGQEVCNASATCLPAVPPVLDDGNPCTADSCDPATGVIHTPVPTGTSCADSTVCNGSETCNSSGACTAGTPLEVPPNTMCTTYSCDPIAGVLATQKPAGASCSNETVCDGQETCNGSGACQPGVPLVVPPNTACTSYACDPLVGIVATPAPNGTSCADSTVCNGAETCAAGECVAGTPPTIPTNTACASFSCDAVAGIVQQNQPTGTTCADQTVCNGAETCDGAGACAAGTALEVPADTACTTYSCDSVAGIVTTQVPAGTSCTNENDCDGAETCDGSGACSAGTGPDLDDKNPCTADACDPELGVTHTPVAEGSSCGDGNACNGAETCDATGACQSGTPVDTDSGNDCTVGQCDPVTGVVTFVPLPENTPCFFDTCTDGACSATGTCLAAGDSVPDDGDSCTLEWCDPVLGPQVKSCASLDPTVGTTVFSATEWLYTGTDPIQQGVAQGTIVVERAAALRGRARTRDGIPLSNVKVTILDHPEFGWTITRADGAFDMVVNGGGDLMVELAKEGYLGLHRRVHASWGEYAQVPDAVMIPPDPVVSPVDLTSGNAFQVAQGSVQSDDSGSRQGTLLIPAGTEATMHLADGTTETLDAMNVRITEFTVGDTGLDAMPGPLPVQSGYTYAFEVNADEAVEAGAPEITFSQPLVYYVDNFLGFPAGTTVPLGAYDRTEGVWKAEETGVVLKILSESGGLANIDVTGDGVADTSLDALGISVAERQNLAALYEPGQGLWRVRLAHFTRPWDCNWNVSPPDDAEPPEQPDPIPDDDQIDDACERGGGSSIECETQVLHEDIPVAGTPFSLHYSSARSQGRTATRGLRIPLSDSSIPGSVKRIDLEISVSGRTFHQSFAPAPNLETHFNWDGRDAFGRVAQGAQRIDVRVAFAYDGVYRSTARFGATGGAIITGDDARGELYFNRGWRGLTGSFDALGLGLGGWSLSGHHVYEMGARHFQKGDGSLVAEREFDVVRHLAGSGNISWQPGLSQFPALSRLLPSALLYQAAQNESGNVFLSTQSNVYRIDVDGVARLVAGTTLQPPQPGGDDLPATTVPLNVTGIAFERGGALILADNLAHKIRRLTPAGLLERVAGSGTSGFSGDGGPAALAQLKDPRMLVVGPDGSKYFIDLGNNRVRSISPDAVIDTVAGNGTTGTPVEGPARQSRLNPRALAVDGDGTVFVAHGITPNPYQIYAVTPDGQLSMHLGCKQAPCGEVDGTPALSFSTTSAINALAAGPPGTLYFQHACRIRAIRNGIVSTIAGKDCNLNQEGWLDEGAPVQSKAPQFTALALGPGGLIGMMRNNGQMTSGQVLFQVDSPLPGLTGLQVGLSDARGRFVDVFEAITGRHIEKRDTLTGGSVLEFEYVNGLVSEVVDAVGRRTAIERTVAGAPVAIVAPDGQRTILEFDANRFLASVTDPNGGRIEVRHRADGLLETFTNARGFTSTMSYDAFGRLDLDQGPDGALLDPARSVLTDGSAVAMTTALGRTTVHELRRGISGSRTRTVTLPDETSTIETSDAGGLKTVALSDGSSLLTRLVPDPRYGMSAAIASTTEVLPSGTARSVAAARSYGGAGPSLTRTDTTVVNGRTWTDTSSSNGLFRTRRSPVGRTVTDWFDAFGRTIRTQVDGLAPIDYVYNSEGRLANTVQGDRTTTHGYSPSGPSQGYLTSITDALGVTTDFSRDALGRLLSETRAADTTLFDWDESGNLTAVTPPGKPEHSMGYTPVHLLSSYEPPAAGLPSSATSYQYSLDRELLTETRPDGLVVSRTYDAAGRLDTVSLPGGTLDYDYYGLTPAAGGAAGRLSQLQGPYGVNLSYAYDGSLTTGTTWSGLITGSASWQYNSDFLPVRESVTGALGTSFAAFGYDNDRLLTCASPSTCSPAGADAFRITRPNTNGLITRTELGAVREDLTYNTYGELARQVSTFSGAGLLDFVYDTTGATRDALGRIAEKTEVVDGIVKVFRYTYDDRGRLTEVLLDGNVHEHFDYDSNGNRLSAFSATSGATLEGDYDDQDRLLGYGDFAYTFTANGELETKTNLVTEEVTLYQYDVLGNLLAVSLPDGTLIEYLVDGRNRRVGKKVNGSLVKQWLYRDQLKPAAELDGSGTLVAQFVYGTKPNVPDFVLRDGKTYRVISDHLGSPRYVVNVNNSSETPYRADYSVFGEVTGTGLDWMPFGFAGGHYDSQTGLVRFGARDYDSGVGRWTAKEPLRFDGATNFYLYAFGDPLNYHDPDGRVAIVIPVAAGILAGAVLLWYELFTHQDELDDIICRIRDGDTIPAPSPDCTQVGVKCTDQCVHLLGENYFPGKRGRPGGGANTQFQYDKCRRDCMALDGC